MFAIVRFALLIAQLYIGFGILSVGLLLALGGLFGSLPAVIGVGVGGAAIWCAWRLVQAIERVREKLSYAIDKD